MYADMQAKQPADGAHPEGGEHAHAGGGASSAHAADDNVVDAEVKEVKKG
jgi:molecular chaperone DnaK